VGAGIASVVAELGISVLEAGTGPNVVLCACVLVKGTGVQLCMRAVTGPIVVGGVLGMLVTASVVFGVSTKRVCSVGPLVFDGKARETMIAASSASARYMFYLGLVMKKNKNLFVWNLRV
jgi:hypothetical protein